MKDSAFRAGTGKFAQGGIPAQSCTLQFGVMTFGQLRRDAQKNGAMSYCSNCDVTSTLGIAMDAEMTFFVEAAELL